VLLRQSDIRPSIRENENQTPLSLALPEGHAGVARILLGLGDINSQEAGNDGQASLLPSARPADELVEMQFSSHDPNTNTANFNTQPRLIPGSHGEQLRLPNLQGSVSDSTAPRPSTRRSWWSLLFSIQPRKLSHPPRKKLRLALTTTSQ